MANEKMTPQKFEAHYMDLQIRTHLVPWDGRVAFCLLGTTIGPKGSQRTVMVTNMELEEAKEGELLTPTFKLSRDQVQALMDELYRVGFRPSEAGTTGELDATKKHLDDMRAIVANAIDVPELKSRR